MLSFFKYSYLFYYSCPSFSSFTLLIPAHPHSHIQPPHRCPHPWVIHTRSLTNPFPFFPPFPSPHFPLAAVSLFHVSMPVVLFCSLVYFIHQILLVSEIIWYLFFTDWLISLSIIVSSSIHVVAKYRNSFSLSAEQYSVVKMDHSFIIHSCIGGHVGCFQHLAIVYSAAMSTGCIISFELVFWDSQGILPAVESLGQKAVPFLIF